MSEFYNKELAKKLTGITDDDILEFYINAIISRIERIVGYKLTKSKINEVVAGVNTNIIYLRAKPVERVSNAIIHGEKLSFRLDEHRMICEYVIYSDEYVEVEYTAGYDKLPADILMFICSTLKENMANDSGLKSFTLKDVSYSYFDKIQQSENFRRGITDIFGVIV